jgi:hypothetical protein
LLDRLCLKPSHAICREGNIIYTAFDVKKFYKILCKIVQENAGAEAAQKKYFEKSKMAGF